MIEKNEISLVVRALIESIQAGLDIEKILLKNYIQSWLTQ